MSNVQQFFGSGGGSNGLYQFHVQTLSGSFTAKTRGKYLITATGGGGAGGTSFGSGGGAGGLAQSLLTLEVGDVVSYICGAGGQSVNASGGTTTVAINGTNILTANGGTGGASGINGAVGTGGTASGGNQMNVTGGHGAVGNRIAPGYGWPYGNGGGGGAVGVYGKVCNAQGTSGWGAGTCGQTSLQYFMCAVEISNLSIVEASESYTYNLGTFASASTGMVPINPQRVLCPTGFSSNSGMGPAPGRGGNPSNNGLFGLQMISHGGIFAGGGCTFGGNGWGQTIVGGNGGLFGGGAAGGPDQPWASGLSMHGKGGDGGVIIEWIAYTL